MTPQGKPPRRVAVRCLVLSAAITLVVAGATGLGALRLVELLGYDILLQVGDAPGTGRVVIVDFDEASVRELRAFPIPRGLLADVIDRIAEGQPIVVGVDVMLDWPRQETDDLRLAESIARAGNVLLVSHWGLGREERVEPLPLFSEASLSAGATPFADLPMDDDELVRRMHLVGTKEFERWSFPIAIAVIATGASVDRVPEGGYRLGSTAIPLASRNPDTAFIRFSPGRRGFSIPVLELLEPAFDPSVFSKKVVLVGQSSSFGRDLLSTPAVRFEAGGEGWRLLSGTEIHAAAIETLLSGRTIRKGGSVPVWTGIFLVTTLLVLLILLLRPLPAILLVGAGAAAVFLVAVALISGPGIWIPWVSAELAVALSLPAGLGTRFLQERRMKALAEAERREMMGMFERYVAPEVAAQIWQRRDEIVLAGEERVATVLFSDIRSFTALTAGKPSAEVLEWLNRYLTAMSDVIRANGGYLNKYIGDGIMALFGVPLTHGEAEDARRAVATALGMLDRVRELNAGRTGGQPELRIGIGLHTGPLTAGSVGSPERMEYSVIGETVNLASRLESLNKTYGTSIVISPHTRELVASAFRTASLGAAEVRGFEGTIELFTVEAGPDTREKP